MVYQTKAGLGVEVIRFEGDLSVLSMIKMKGRMNRLLNRNQKRLLLDLAETRRVELAGVGLLVDRLRKVREQKGDIKLCNLRPEVEKTFRLIGVNGLMESYSTQEEAIRSFAS
ncbi:MAG TPA: STAS domain-containing protein [Candidatus Omnitrophota bacterium]|jgi:anti-anti-sigma factor|nr:MAG: Anti-sigma-B factor antagonist [Candidatus Omnitrophica bacterium ADurb.Bin314]HOE68692.1 STAS domain-containing protein [Candidatus Omnitrophota bacterium]HQB94029.1 STAS domain-containing protein [Candidatus Omnitrophota bacterium]